MAFFVCVLADYHWWLHQYQGKIPSVLTSDSEVTESSHEQEEICHSFLISLAARAVHNSAGDRSKSTP